MFDEIPISTIQVQEGRFHSRREHVEQPILALKTAVQPILSRPRQLRNNLRIDDSPHSPIAIGTLKIHGY